MSRRSPRVVVVGFVLAALASGLPGCMANVGHPASPDARSLRSLANDQVARGDLVAAEHLYERAERVGAGTLHGVLAMLGRHRVGRDAVRRTMAGAPGAVRADESLLRRCPR